jgi:hypothetical protein
MAPDCLARCIIKREDMRTLLRYVRRREGDVAEVGRFWWFALCNDCPSVFRSRPVTAQSSSPYLGLRD